MPTIRGKVDGTILEEAFEAVVFCDGSVFPCLRASRLLNVFLKSSTRRIVSSAFASRARSLTSNFSSWTLPSPIPEISYDQGTNERVFCASVNLQSPKSSFHFQCFFNSRIAPSFVRVSCVQVEPDPKLSGSVFGASVGLTVMCPVRDRVLIIVASSAIVCSGGGDKGMLNRTSFGLDDQCVRRRASTI